MLLYQRKWLYERMALNYMTAGKTYKAEKWYKKLEAIEPRGLAVLHNLGVICISLKKFREAENYINREIEIYGESPVRLRVLGDLYYMEGNMDEAGRIYGRALTLFQVSGEDKTAQNLLRKRISICKDKSLSAKAAESSMLLEPGPVLPSKGLAGEALDSFLRAAEYDKSSYMALNSAGTVLMNHMKDYNGARDCFRRALELADIPVIKQNLSLAEYKIRETGGNR